MSEGNHARFMRLLDEQLAQGKTQGQIAKKIGVAQQYLSDVKTGIRPVTARFAFRVADAFKVEPQSLYRTKD